MNQVETDAKATTPNYLTVPRIEINEETPGPKENVSIEQSDARKFVERKYNNDSLAYARNGSEPGKLLIFNYEFAQDPQRYRRGSRRDVMEVVTNFQRLGFNITNEDIHTDCPRDELLKVLNDVAESDLREVNCLIVFFFTHGQDNNTLHTTDLDITIDNIYQIFDKCEDLKNKPKMFIFQACKGDGYTTTTGAESNPLQENILPMNTLTYDFPPDMILLFSTTEGNVSYRSALGSWFIQELCRNFYAYGRRDDVTSLVIRTTKCVCGNYYHHDEYENVFKKQMPLMISTLRKKFYLNTNKDRHLILKISQDIEDIKNQLKRMEEKRK